MTDQDREAFEAWASSPNRYDLLRDHNDDYRAAITQASWHAWQAARAQPADFQVLAITTAYEQGVGKGRQAYKRGEEISNPYNDGYSCDQAWQMGYDEGKKQAARAQPAQEPVVNNKFTRAWLKLDELPGTMLHGPNGLFGPIPCSTSAWVTTSEKEFKYQVENGHPMLEVFTQPPRQPLSDEQIEALHWGEMSNRDLSFARAVEAAIKEQQP